MKRKNKTVIILSVIFALILIIGVSAYAASNYGTQSDPLVTLSYIEDIFVPDIMGRINNQIQSAVSGLENEVGKAIDEHGSIIAETYTLVLLEEGKTLTGSLGAEVILRYGEAGVAHAETDIIDATAGGAVAAGGSLTLNHLCMITADGTELVSSGGTAELLVRGNVVIK